MRLFRYRGLFANRDCCNNLLGTVLCVQTPVPCCSTPTITPTWTQVPAGSPTSTPSLTPTPTPAVCIWNNHECNPVCEIENFEGGEMWKRIDTSGFKNVRVEFELKADGFTTPHGRRLPGSDYVPDTRGVPPWSGVLPYNVCKDTRPAVLNSCIDCLQMEDVFEVWYTADFDPPYNTSFFPSFRREGTFLDGGILNWRLARVIPREILRLDYSSWRKVSLDFSMQDDTDNNPDFGLWFRCQFDTDANELNIRNIEMKGVQQ